MNELVQRCKNGVVAVGATAGMLVAGQASAAVAAATTAVNGAETQAEAIITLGFAVAGTIAGLWVAISIIKRLIKKAAS